MPDNQGMEPEQTLQFPPRLEDDISTENPVRFLDAFVAELDLQAMGFRRVEAAVAGRPAYHPGDWLKLYLMASSIRFAKRRC